MGLIVALVNHETATTSKSQVASLEAKRSQMKRVMPCDVVYFVTYHQVTLHTASPKRAGRAMHKGPAHVKTRCQGQHMHNSTELSRPRP